MIFYFSFLWKESSIVGRDRKTWANSDWVNAKRTLSRKRHMPDGKLTYPCTSHRKFIRSLHWGSFFKTLKNYSGVVHNCLSCLVFISLCRVLGVGRSWKERNRVKVRCHLIWSGSNSSSIYTCAFVSDRIEILTRLAFAWITNTPMFCTVSWICLNFASSMSFESRF